VREHYSPFPFPTLPSPPFLCPPAAKRLPENQLRSLGSSVISPSGRIRILLYFEFENRTQLAATFFTNALKTAVSARSVGTTFKNLHQQKFRGFRISGRGNFPPAVCLEETLLGNTWRQSSFPLQCLGVWIIHWLVCVLRRAASYAIECPPMGDVRRVNIRHDDSAWNPSWFLERIMINDLQKDGILDCSCFCWLDSSQGDGKISRVLNCTKQNSMFYPTSLKIFSSFQASYIHRHHVTRFYIHILAVFSPFGALTLFAGLHEGYPAVYSWVLVCW